MSPYVKNKAVVGRENMSPSTPFHVHDKLSTTKSKLLHLSHAGENVLPQKHQSTHTPSASPLHSLVASALFLLVSRTPRVLTDNNSSRQQDLISKDSNPCVSRCSTFAHVHYASNPVGTFWKYIKNITYNQTTLPASICL